MAAPDEQIDLTKLPLTQRKERAVQWRKAGMSPTAIARRLALGSAKRVDQIVAEQLQKDAPKDSGLDWHALELARLDDVYRGLVVAREKGAAGVEKDMLRVLDYRIRLQSAQNREPGRMHQAVLRALEGLDLVAADEAAKQSALDMATMIDVAMSVGTADDQRRAINAMATMRNLLNDLGASPAARDEVDGIARAARGSQPEAAERERDPDKGAEVLSFMERAQRRMKGA